MQSSNERLTTGPGSGAGALSELTESDRRARDSLASYREFAFIQPATARPMAGPESSWMKCEPGTVTSLAALVIGHAAALHVDGVFRERRFSQFAAMKIDRPNPVRWCSA